jgi:hypothetical protein
MKLKTETTAMSINQITMITKLLTLVYEDGDGIELTIDVKTLMMADEYSEDAYINITPIAKHFNKFPAAFLRLPSTKEYIQLLENESNSNYAFSAQLNDFLDDKESKNNRLNEREKTIKFVITKRGKYDSGTWLHKDLFLEFAGWVSVRFRFDMHQLMKYLILHANHVKQDRMCTKHLYHPLTDVIKEIYIPAQSNNGKKFSYSNLANLINKKVIDTTARKYKIDNNIDPEASIRDTFTDNILQKIEEAERDLHGYIKYREVTDYVELKRLMLKNKQ